MAEAWEAVIIGGGISGLACARRLHEAGARFLLVTDHLGGRMHHSADGTMNFGATYVNEDYRRVLRYVDRQIPFRLHETYFSRAGRLSTLLHWRSLGVLTPIVRLIRRLREYRRALEAFRRDGERAPQIEARPRHPLVDRYSRQPALELIAELGMQEVDEVFGGPAFRTTAFAEPSEATALFYLGSLLPLIVRTWVADFSRTYQRLTAGYADRIVLDRAVELARDRQGRFVVATRDGRSLPASHVVIAVPHADAQAFYPVPKPRVVTSATILFVRGRRRDPYEGKPFVLFSSSAAGIAAIWSQGHGWDQVYALRPNPDLAEFYASYEILQAVSWKTAIVLSDAHWTPLELEPHLYLAGDYNLCGLEDSYVTGLCAANRILGNA